MKKILMIISAALLLATSAVFTGCKNGEDGADGTSAEALILKETGNVWYEYTDTSDTTSKPTGTAESKTVNLTDVYLKYDTSGSKLIIAAVSPSDSGLTSLVYAQTEKELSSGKWAASVVTLKLLGKITKSKDQYPTSGKVNIANANWGNFTAEYLIGKLFE